MRYVNPACSSPEQNLVACQNGRDIYFYTIRPVEPNQELLVWYSQEFAQRLCGQHEDIKKSEQLIILHQDVKVFRLSFTHTFRRRKEKSFFMQLLVIDVINVFWNHATLRNDSVRSSERLMIISCFDGKPAQLHTKNQHDKMTDLDPWLTKPKAYGLC